MRHRPPLRHYVYVMPTIWLIMGMVILLLGLAFSSMGLAVILPVMLVSTIAGIVAVYTQT